MYLESFWLEVDVPNLNAYIENKESLALVEIRKCCWFVSVSCFWGHPEFCLFLERKIHVWLGMIEKKGHICLLRIWSHLNWPYTLTFGLCLCVTNKKNPGKCLFRSYHHITLTVHHSVSCVTSLQKLCENDALTLSWPSIEKYVCTCWWHNWIVLPFLSKENTRKCRWVSRGGLTQSQKLWHTRFCCIYFHWLGNLYVLVHQLHFPQFQGGNHCKAAEISGNK